MVSPSAGPDAVLVNKQKAQMIDTLLTRLPELQRAAFVLFEIEGYSGEEIARFQQVPINTVWARIHKARVKLAAAASKMRRYR